MRIGIAWETFAELDATEDGRLLKYLLSEAAVRPVVIPTSNRQPPKGFEHVTVAESGTNAWMHWAQYHRELGTPETRLEVAALLEESVMRERLLVDDPWYRHVAGLKPIAGFAFPADGRSRQGAAFQLLVAKALRCDLFITDLSAAVDLDGDTGFQYPVETVSVTMAVPLIGLYLRRCGVFGLTLRDQVGKRTNRSESLRAGYDAVEFFNLAVASCLPRSCEWSSLSRKIDDPDAAANFKGYASSVTHRLEQVLRARDGLLEVLAVSPSSIEPAYVAGDLFDQVLLFSLAAVDATAEAVNSLFALGKVKPMWTTEGFRNAARTLAAEVVELFEERNGGEHYQTWKVMSELRNSIHSAAMSYLPEISVVGDFAGRMMLPIPGHRFVSVKKVLKQPDELRQWGIFEATGQDTEARLHPGVFVEQLVPRAFGLINQIMTRSIDAHARRGDQKYRSQSILSLSFPERARLKMLGLECVSD